MRLVAQPLDEIQDRIARRQLERRAAWNKEGFAAGIAVRAFGDGDERNVGTEAFKRLARRRELALAAVDEDKVRPGRIVLALAGRKRNRQRDGSCRRDRGGSARRFGK